MHLDTHFVPPSSGLLSIAEIAAWQVPDALDGERTIVAALPALQRGAVWKPQQIEALWDSLIRGFPIGAFMLTPFDQDRGKQRAPHDQPGIAEPNHHLLDGQQRSTALALGFLNPWKPVKDVNAVLWVDLGEPPESSDMDLIFRVVTCSHPWGYRRSDAARTIETKRMREAMDAYRGAATAEYATTPPRQFPLDRVWPIDAECPIPLAIVIEEIRQGEADDAVLAANVRARMADLPFWGKGESSWQQSVTEALSGKDAKASRRFGLLAQGLRALLEPTRGYRVPCLVLPAIPAAETRQADDQDPVETLFIRVNQGGTRLDGEELIYSILKSIWTDAPSLIEGLGHQLALPSRLVVLCSRLVLAERDSETSLPRAPDVSRFRRLMHGSDRTTEHFAEDLKRFLQTDGQEESQGCRVFRIAKRLLTEGPYALPPVLATNLAQKSPAVMLLLLRWIVRMLDEKREPLLPVNGKARKRLLGFLTALGWFGENQEQAVAAVWSKLQTAKDAELERFFSPANFGQTLGLGRAGGLHMIPLPPPHVLDKMIADSVTAARGTYGGFGDPQHGFWTGWNWFDWMSGRMSRDLSIWYTENIHARWKSADVTADGETIDANARFQDAWTAFINGLSTNHNVLLYGQRHALASWFEDYDPSQPDQLEDVNRPWDYDHIHPQSYLKSSNGNTLRNIPRIVWDWHSTIGNLRAWPLELNRGDSNATPDLKLGSDNPRTKQIEAAYGLKNDSAKKKASFIKNDWEHWKKCVPTGQCPRNYLALADQYGVQRQELIRAITTRFSALYREWHETLKVEDLMSGARL